MRYPLSRHIIAIFAAILLIVASLHACTGGQSTGASTTSPTSSGASEGAMADVATSLTQDPLGTNADSDTMADASASEPITNPYTCPMHPEVRHQGPGQCPVCGMNLVPVSQPTVDAGTQSDARADARTGARSHSHAGHAH